MKLELKHLKNYLGTGLKGVIADDGIVRELHGLYKYTLQVIPSKHGFTHCVHEYFKPLLLPLSALIEPMEDGSVPIVDLAKMLYSEISWTGKFKLVDNEVHFDSYESFNLFWYDYESKEFMVRMYETDSFPENQLQLFEYLFANHFDVYGLIPAGLAIDKRTIKT